ncbi:MAG TPA: O-antigen ligase family protein [Vicinamibacterales bacterium]
MADSAGAIWWRPETEAAPAIPGVGGKSLAFGGLVVFTVVLLLSPQTFLPILKTIRIALLAAVVAIAAHAMDATVRREPVTPSGTETSITVALLGWTVLTLPFSMWPGGSFALLTDQYIKALVFFWMIAAMVTNRERLITLAWSLTVCSIPLALSALMHFAKGDFLSTGTSIQRIEGYAGLSGNPNDLALTLNLLIPFTGALLFTTRSWLGRAIAALALFVSIPAVIVTFSRAGFLTLVAIGIMGVFCFMRRGAVVPAVALIVLALAIAPALPKGYVERVSTIVDIDADPTGSAQGRWTDYQVATDVVIANPVLGVGLGQDILALNAARGRATWRSVHNAFLEYAVDLGIPGILLFLSLLFVSFGTARRVERYAQRARSLWDVGVFATAAQVALVAFAVAAFFHPIAYQFYFFCVAGLAVAVRNVSRNEAPQFATR